MASSLLNMTSSTISYFVTEITLMSQVFDHLVNAASLQEKTLSSLLFSKTLTGKLDFFRIDLGSISTMSNVWNMMRP